MDMAKVRRYRDLRAAQSASEVEAKTIKAEADELEQQLLEEFAEEGTDSVSLDGTTVYLRRDLFAAKKDGIETPDVVKALVACGLGHFVTDTYNANTLSAHLRALDDTDTPLPPELDEVIYGFEKYSIRTRAAGASGRRSRKND